MFNACVHFFTSAHHYFDDSICKHVQVFYLMKLYHIRMLQFHLSNIGHLLKFIIFILILIHKCLRYFIRRETSELKLKVLLNFIEVEFSFVFLIDKFSSLDYTLNYLIFYFYFLSYDFGQVKVTVS